MHSLRTDLVHDSCLDADFLGDLRLEVRFMQRLFPEDTWCLLASIVDLNDAHDSVPTSFIQEGLGGSARVYRHRAQHQISSVLHFFVNLI